MTHGMTSCVHSVAQSCTSAQSDRCESRQPQHLQTHTSIQVNLYASLAVRAVEVPHPDASRGGRNRNGSPQAAVGSTLAFYHSQIIVCAIGTPAHAAIILWPTPLIGTYKRNGATIAPAFRRSARPLKTIHMKNPQTYRSIRMWVR